MVISFYSEQIKPPLLNKKKINSLIKCIAFDFKKKLGNISVIFCKDEYLLEINKKYLNHDYYTDIITFNYNEENNVSGDLFISLERVYENAKSLNQPTDIETLRVIVHGFLHLIGINDKSVKEKAEMTKFENLYLKKYKEII
ncbi:MAG: rRNA maturation RNase YbeY [Bacteroidetes bacterium GWA2_30_7]|nr:MAG: rRNA maturation RNase YbeY [Bacteroidetes bacterium GWA2_30_7]